MLMNGGITGLIGPEHAGHPRADVRRGHRLRRHVARVPMILMPRMQNVAQVGQHVRANQRAAVHHAGRCAPAPGVILMLSTTVSIAGNVLITFSTGSPTSNGS